MSSLSNWVRKKFSKEDRETGNQNTNSQAPSPGPPSIESPALPPSRPRILTPSPPKESLFASAPCGSENSAFFQRLPFEIRCMILTEAIGNRTIHIDLTQYAQRPIKRRPRARGWYWSGSVCRRTQEGAAPFDDLLRIGQRPRAGMENLYFGAMGWLVSCRQAYTEGIDILYSTNTIHICRIFMISRLPELFLPQRLASITSIEIMWYHITSAGVEASSDLNLPAFHSLLKDIPSILPRLKKLFISFKSGKTPSPRLPSGYLDETIKITESVIMEPIDDMVRKLGPRLQECNIAIPASFYEQKKFKAKRKMCVYPRPS